MRGDQNFPWFTTNPAPGFPGLAGNALPAKDLWNDASVAPFTPNYGGISAGSVYGTQHNSQTGQGGPSVNFSDFDNYANINSVLGGPGGPMPYNEYRIDTPVLAFTGRTLGP